VFSSLSFVDSRPIIYVRRRGWGKSDDFRGKSDDFSGECFIGSEGMDASAFNYYKEFDCVDIAKVLLSFTLFCILLCFLQSLLNI